jgi:hypothetical protein
MGASSVIVKLTFGNLYFGDRVYENLVPWHNNKKKPGYSFVVPIDTTNFPSFRHGQ